jgi:hypothetical protein
MLLRTYMLLIWPKSTVEINCEPHTASLGLSSRGSRYPMHVPQFGGEFNTDPTPSTAGCETLKVTQRRHNRAVPSRPDTQACETVPGTGEVARFPVETLGTHKKDGNTEHNVTSTGSPTATPGNESLTKQPHSTSLYVWPDILA